MPLTPATLSRHELVGLRVEVVAASNADLVGIAGSVVDETTNTLSIESAMGERVWQVPKADATFEFTIDGETGGAEQAQVVTVEGERLEARPARRTERTGDSKWR